MTKALMTVDAMIWEFLDPRLPADGLGFIPEFLTPGDPRCAREQIHDRYISGWQSFDGFHMDKTTYELTYPGDPPMKPLARSWLRNELLLFYDCAWLAIVQPNGSYEIARLD